MTVYFIGAGPGDSELITDYRQGPAANPAMPADPVRRLPKCSGSGWVLSATKAAYYSNVNAVIARTQGLIQKC